MNDDLELVRGSDNPFEDVGLPEADTKLIKADLAAEIIAILRERRLTGAAAAKMRPYILTTVYTCTKYFRKRQARNALPARP